MVKNTKTNNLNSVGGHTGGLPVIHDVATKKTELKVPPNTLPPTPEPVKEAAGFAKASPNFKGVEPKVKASKEEEKKALEANSVEDKSVKDSSTKSE